MVERLVRADQLAELLDDRELRAQVGLLLGLERGDELVAAGTVVAEELLQAHLGAVDRGREGRLVAPLPEEGAAGRLDLGAADAVEGDLERLHLAADRLHGTLGQQRGEDREQLLLALAGEALLADRRRRERFGRSLLGRLVLDLQAGALGRQRGLLVGKVDRGHRRGLLLDVGELLRPGHHLGLGTDPGAPGAGRRVAALRRLPGGRGRIGHGIRILLGRGAGKLLGSGKGRIFSSHRCRYLPARTRERI